MYPQGTSEEPGLMPMALDTLFSSIDGNNAQFCVDLRNIAQFSVRMRNYANCCVIFMRQFGVRALEGHF